MTNRKRKLNNKRNLTCKRLFNLNPSNNTANNDIPSLAEDIEDTETLDYEYGLQDEEHDKSSESEVENESVVEHVNVSKSPRINNSLEPSFPMYTVSKSNTNNFISNINGNDDQYIPEDDFILNGTNSNGNENYTPCSSLIDSESDDCESLVVSEASTSSNYVAKNPVPLNGLNKPESTQINNNIVNFKFNVSSLMALRKNTPQNEEEEEENDTVCESTINSPVSDSVYDKKKWTQFFDLSSVMPRITSDDFIFNAVKPFHEFQINDELNDSPVDSPNESIFKIPLKRPPTRPVKTASIQPQLVSPPVLQSDEVIEIDDTISLACSSLVDDEDFEVKEEPLSRSDESSPSASSVPNAEQTLEKPANKKISFGEIPPLFRNICYYFFLYSNCKKKFCALPHNMNNGKFINNIKRASNEDLVKAFKWAREHRFFYQHIFKIMAGAFMWRKMYSMVGDMLLDVPEFAKTIDKETAVDFVLTQLQQSKNFKENLFCIINKINFAHHEALRNLMINAISKHDNLDELCDILPKLIAGKTTEIENRVVIRLMDKSLNTTQANNKRLCNFLGDLIQKKCIDFGKIPKNLSHPFGLYMRCSTNGVDILPGHIFEDKDNNAEESGSLCSYRTEDNLYYPSTTDNTENLDRLSDVDLDNLESVSQVGYVEPFHVPQETQGSNDFERTEMFVEELRRKLIGEQPPPQLPPPPQPPQTLFFPFSSVSPNVPHTPSPLNYQQPSPLNYQQPSPSNNQQPSANIEPAPVPSPEPMPIPKFGHLVLEANFKLNVSLHNSLPLSPAKGCVDLHDADIMQLDRSIKHHDGLNFLRVFDAYKTSYTQQNFVTQTIAALKSSGERSFHYFSKLLESIRSINPSWMTDKLLKAILEVVAMNIIVALEQKQCLKECVTLLLQFYDWDALITCKIFTQHFNYTIMGRYLFLAKLFSKANRFDFTFEILQSPKLKILEYQHDWPFQNCHHDLNTKNILLKDFFKYGYKYNAISTVELYKRIFQGAPVEDEILSNFNPMMKNILDNKVVPVLKQIMEDINIFEPHMEKNILKAFFLIVIEKRITKSKETHNLYLKCVKKGIYPSYCGQEAVVIIKTNYTEEEIRLTFEYYFNKIVQFPAKDVAVQISVPNETNYNEIPNVLNEKFRSFNEIYSNIREILCDDYFINIPLIANTHIAIKSSTISTVIDGLVQSYGLAKS
ncbi:unnamed protein product [Brassicogethes aeneus]|uniref:Uncharacterized protein n=1 Tax=Brassicogethes aeneus TaxID=1431903 RepID=A0A9P0AWG7_BRAAE|nr:unnamed protein product [Brassicogethes aeneus]